MMISGVPSIREQRLEALNRANGVRSRRSIAKREMAAMDRQGACRYICELIASPPPWGRTWLIKDLLLSVPMFGKVKIRKLLSKFGIREGLEVAALTPRQRDEIIGYLSGLRD